MSDVRGVSEDVRREDCAGQKEVHVCAPDADNGVDDGEEYAVKSWDRTG